MLELSMMEAMRVAREGKGPWESQAMDCMGCRRAEVGKNGEKRRRVRFTQTENRKKQAGGRGFRLERSLRRQ